MRPAGGQGTVWIELELAHHDKLMHFASLDSRSPLELGCFLLCGARTLSKSIEAIIKSPHDALSLSLSLLEHFWKDDNNLSIYHAVFW